MRIDRFLLDDASSFYVMDVIARYSSARANEAIHALELAWMFLSWPQGAVRADGAFQTNASKPFVPRNGIQIRPVPSRRHGKNMTERRHGSFSPSSFVFERTY